MTATQQLMAGNDNASYIRILISFLSTLGCFGSVMAFFEKIDKNSLDLQLELYGKWMVNFVRDLNKNDVINEMHLYPYYLCPVAIYLSPSHDTTVIDGFSFTHIY